MPADKNLPVWLSSADRRRSEPASILSYDEQSLSLSSLIAYSEGDEILIGVSVPLLSKGHNRDKIMDLMKVKIDRREQIETAKGSCFQYKAKYMNAFGSE